MSEALPVGGVPDGTDYEVWLRAAAIGGTTVVAILQDTLPVQAVAYHRALDSIAEETAAAAAAMDEEIGQAPLGVHLQKIGSFLDPIVAMTRRRDRQSRWDLHMRAEKTLTEALGLLQDNDVLECMRRLQLAQQQVFEVTVLDKTDQKVEG